MTTYEVYIVVGGSGFNAQRFAALASNAGCPGSTSLQSKIEGKVLSDPLPCWETDHHKVVDRFDEDTLANTLQKLVTVVEGYNLEPQTTMTLEIVVRCSTEAISAGVWLSPPTLLLLHRLRAEVDIDIISDLGDLVSA